MWSKIIARPPDDHGRALENANGNEEGSRVPGSVVLRGNEHDVADRADDCAGYDKSTTRPESVRVECAGEHSEEGGHVGGHRQELRGGGVVAHAGDDGWEEQRE